VRGRPAARSSRRRPRWCRSPTCGRCRRPQAWTSPTASAVWPTACRHLLHDTGTGLPVDPAASRAVRQWGVDVVAARRDPTGSPTNINSWNGHSVLCCSQPLSTSRCGGVPWRFE
jgi:hypothetical protein